MCNQMLPHATKMYIVKFSPVLFFRKKNNKPSIFGYKRKKIMLSY